MTHEKNNRAQITKHKSREYIGPMLKIITVISITWALFQFYYSSIGIMSAIESRAWYFGFLTILIFILYPATNYSKKVRKIPSIFDLLWILITLLSVGYFLITFDTFITSGGVHVPLDYLFGALGILVAFEAARRTVGYALTGLALVFLLYNLFGGYISGTLGHSGVELKRLIEVMWWGSQGIFGTVLGAAVTYIFVFIIFGAFLKKAGALNFINDAALAVTGQFAGGPAKVAVFGSTLMGMISGSGVANVATTGTMTIPMMKKTGYKGHFAGAVEAVASTGGLLTPPIMGAAAFIMAEFIGIPFREIMIAATIPAILYFTMTFTSVHFEAKKLGLKGISKKELPNLMEVLKKSGHLILPIILLIFLILYGLTPLYAAIWAVVSTVVVSWVKKETRMGLKKILQALEDGVKGVLLVSAACAIVGIIVGTITLTSIGLTLGNSILELAGDNILLVAIFTMIISIILGMGVPPSASYIVTAIVSAPLLVSMGVPILVAHMFAFYYAALSDITPPVALASMAASGIAEESFVKVSITAVRLGLIGFMIPYFFLYNPSLLFEGDNILLSILSGITAVIGVIALASSLSNWLLTKTNGFQRIILIASGLLLIYPDYLSDLFGILLFILVLFWQKFVGKNSLAKIY